MLLCFFDGFFLRIWPNPMGLKYLKEKKTVESRFFRLFTGLFVAVFLMQGNCVLVCFPVLAHQPQEVVGISFNSLLPFGLQVKLS